MFKMIKVKDIIISDRKRDATDTKYIQTLAKSIKETTLIQNITIDKNNKLISGLHRIKALQLLNILETNAKVLDITELQSELVEIDENIVRKNLNTIEFYEQLARKKVIYEELYPESTKEHKVKLNLKKKKSNIKTNVEKELHHMNNNSETNQETFVQNLSKQMDVSKRNIQKKVKTAINLEKVKSDLVSTLKEVKNISDVVLNEVIKLDDTEQDILKKKIDLSSKTTSTKDVKQYIEEIKNEKIIQKLKEEKPFKPFELRLNKCYLGKCEEVLSKVEDGFFTSCITDVPYGLSYLNNIWDYDMPSQKSFNEIYRTLKDGAFFITTFSSRSDLVLELLKRVEKSGFNMNHSNMNWIYSTGMGRANKIKDEIERKDIDIDSELFKDERGTHLKPRFEPIFVFQKPIPRSKTYDKDKKLIGTSKNQLKNTLNSVFYHDTAKGTISHNFIDNNNNKKMSANIISFESNNERIDKFFSIKNWTDKLNISEDFLDVAKPSSAERLLDINGNKISSDNDEEQKHDTVKPIALYLYLLKMFDTNSSPIVLEPFAGSGSTLIAAELLDYNFLGVEMEQTHYEIIKKRLLQEDNFIV